MIRRTSKRKVRSPFSYRGQADNELRGCVTKGLFGVPLELLVEREGADSLHGASRATLRVPSFIDDVISAMRQMGRCLPRLHILTRRAYVHVLHRRYVRRGHFQEDG